MIGASVHGMPEAQLRALVFTSLVVANIGLILVNRSYSSSLASALLRPNRALWMLLTGVAATMALALFWAPARTLFHFGELGLAELALCIAAGASSMLLLEAIKWLWFRVRPGDDGRDRFSTLPGAGSG